MTKIEKQKRELKKLMQALLSINYYTMQYALLNTNDPKQRKLCRTVIKNTDIAYDIVEHIQHIEILESLYRTFVANKEHYYVVIASSIKKNVKRWDKSEEGFQEFLNLEEESQTKFKEEQEQRIKTQETIKKAKEEGKKVEMIFKDGKLEPVIVDEKKE